MTATQVTLLGRLLEIEAGDDDPRGSKPTTAALRVEQTINHRGRPSKSTVDFALVCWDPKLFAGVVVGDLLAVLGSLRPGPRVKPLDMLHVGCDLQVKVNFVQIIQKGGEL